MLLEADQVSRARLMATAQKESWGGGGNWLNASPVSAFGTLLDPESFRVAIALSVGADVCILHSCRCVGRMDSIGLLIKRALQKAGLPSVLKPPWFDRGDDSRPDGITVFPFSGGRSLVWDYTRVGSFSGVDLNRSAMEAGTDANRARGAQTP